MNNSEVIARATDIASELKSIARMTDEAGVTAETVARLSNASLLDAGSSARIVEIGRSLGSGCGATAWIATSLAVGASILSHADPATQNQLAGSRVLHIGELDDVSFEYSDEKLCLNGTLANVGGLDHADWVAISGLDFDGEAVCALISRDDIEAHAYPYRGGLRGLNWRSISLKSTPVLLSRISKQDQYLLSEGVVLIGVLMGVLQGGYDDYVGATRARISGIGGQSVAQFIQVQARLAETHAEIKTLTILYETILSRIEAGEARHPECVRDRVYIARKSIEALNRLLAQMGAMGLSETNPVQRRFRDLRSLACARGLDWTEHMPAFGEYELGLRQ